VSASQDSKAVPFVQNGAAEQYELYKAWVGAGFTPGQALDMVKSVILAVLRKEGLC
jgi:hypothetical protein